MITVDGETIPWKAGMTVADVAATVKDGHDYAVFRLNGRLVSRPNFDETPVPDASEILSIPMIAGG